MAMFPNTCPQLGDDEVVLLGKIAQSLCTGGGAGVSSISVNGGPPLSGALSLTIPSDHTGLYLLKTGDTGTGPFFFTPSAPDQTPLTLSNSLTGASVAPALNINTTWNTTGAPMALMLNATDTASGAASQLFDFLLNSVSVANLRKDGRLTLNGRLSTTSTAVGNIFTFSDAGTANAPTGLAFQHTTSGGATSPLFGYSIDWNLDSTTTPTTLAARLTTDWTVATHATRSSRLVFLNFVGGAFSTAMILGDGQIQSSGGTVALPAFTNRSDVDTGVYFPAANAIGFSTAGVLALTINSAGVAVHEAPVRLKGYTVATLPAGTQGDTAFVTDATAPVFLAAAVGGGAVVTPVFYNGATWVAG